MPPNFLRRTLATASLAAATSVCGVAYAQAAPLVVGHRGASTATIPENTLKAMKYANPHAGMLEADIRWTKDSSDADTVGTMVILHDSTLNRTTNCTGYIKDRLWGYVRDHCRTDIADQPVMKLTQLIAYANVVGKPILFHMKIAMSTAQAKQFWKAAKTAPAGSVLAGSAGCVDGIKKVKGYDAKDTGYRLRYGYVTSGEPSAAYVKTVGPHLVIKNTISASKVTHYKNNGLTVYLWVGKTPDDYRSMVGKKPNAVIVDNPPAYTKWKAGA